MLQDAMPLLALLPPVFPTEEAESLLSAKYLAPNKALEAMEKKGLVTRLKRGLYCVGTDLDPLSIAAFLHGASYLSFETALSHYGLIPERTEGILSVVDGRAAVVNSPIGRFEYLSQSRGLFALGMDLDTSSEIPLPIATKEKAVLDSLARAKLIAKKCSPEDIYRYVNDGLRIDESELMKLSLSRMRKLAPLYRNLAPAKLTLALEAKKKEGAR